MIIYLALEHNSYDGMVEEIYAFSTELKRDQFLEAQGRIIRNRELIKYGCKEDLEIGHPDFKFIGISTEPQLDNLYKKSFLKDWAMNWYTIEDIKLDSYESTINS